MNVEVAPTIVLFGPGVANPRPMILTAQNPRGTFVYVPAPPGRMTPGDSGMKRYLSVTRPRLSGGDSSVTWDFDAPAEWRAWLALWRPNVRWSILVDNETGLVVRRVVPEADEAVAS